MDTLIETVNHAEKVLQLLSIPYRVIELGYEDLGHAASITFDIETYISQTDSFLEVSSISSTSDYQSRRLGLKTQGSNKELLHLINGSGLAVGRTMLSLIDAYQCKDGTGNVRIPEVLLPYYGKSTNQIVEINV